MRSIDQALHARLMLLSGGVCHFVSAVPQPCRSSFGVSSVGKGPLRTPGPALQARLNLATEEMGADVEDVPAAPSEQRRGHTPPLAICVWHRSPGREAAHVQRLQSAHALAGHQRCQGSQ